MFLTILFCTYFTAMQIVTSKITFRNRSLIIVANLAIDAPIYDSSVIVFSWFLMSNFIKVLKKTFFIWSFHSFQDFTRKEYRWQKKKRQKSNYFLITAHVHWRSFSHVAHTFEVTSYDVCISFVVNSWF